MPAPDDILWGIKEAIKSSGRLPSSTTYAIFELDPEGGQSNLYPPIVEITTEDTVRSTSLNTDRVGPSLDDNGNEVGYIYHAGFEMPVTIDVVTAEHDEYDPHELARDVRYALYQYEDRMENAALPDPDGGTLSNVSSFQMMNGQPANDLGMTPAMRRWRQSAEIRFTEVVDTADEYGLKDYVKTVHLPDGDAVDGTEFEIVLDGTPSTASPADDWE